MVTTIKTNEKSPCETNILIGLQGEYTKLVVQLETEIDLLTHVLECSTCMGNLISLAKGTPNPSYKQFTRLISGYDKKTDPKAFIVKRINIRLGQLEKLREDAISELKNLHNTLNSSIQP